MPQNNNHHLLNYLTKLQQLLDFELDFNESIAIDDVLKDPEKFATDYIGQSFTTIVDRIQASYENGQEFAKRNV